MARTVNICPVHAGLREAFLRSAIAYSMLTGEKTNLVFSTEKEAQRAMKRMESIAKEVQEMIEERKIS